MILASLAVLFGMALFFVSVAALLIAIDMGPHPRGAGIEIWAPLVGMTAGVVITALPFL